MAFCGPVCDTQKISVVLNVPINVYVTLCVIIRNSNLTCLTVDAAESRWTRTGVSTGTASSWVAVSTAARYCQTNIYKSLGNQFTE